MADQSGDLGQVWNRVIADLSGASPQSGTATLSSQQRAFLRLTRPLGLLDGTALLAAPSDFAKDAIERILRQPISEALGRHLGVSVTLAVVVDASAASGGSEVPDPPSNGASASRTSQLPGADAAEPPTWSPVSGRDELRRPGTGPLEIVEDDRARAARERDNQDGPPSYSGQDRRRATPERRRAGRARRPSSTRSTPSTPS